MSYICEHAPGCRCEMKQVSPHVAAPVANEETLIRLVVDDTHVKRADNGKLELKSTFLSDVETFGSSTLRLGRATTEEFRRQISSLLEAGKQKADGTPREVIGFVRVPVATIRSLMTTKDKNQEPLVVRMCGAYATGLPDVPNHADLALNAYHQLSGNGRLRLVKELGASVASGFQVVNSVDEILALGV